jgi:hypothetical protein
MSVKVVGLKALMKAYKKAPEVTEQEIKTVLNENAVKMVESARENHDYISKSGNLSKSIKKRYSRNKTTHSQQVKVFISPTLVTTEKGFNYGWIQHDGSGSGYRQSGISPAVSPHKFKNGGGIDADHFLERAINKYDDDMRRDLNNVPKKVKKLFK